MEFVTGMYQQRFDAAVARFSAAMHSDGAVSLSAAPAVNPGVTAHVPPEVLGLVSSATDALIASTTAIQVPVAMGGHKRPYSSTTAQAEGDAKPATQSSPKRRRGRNIAALPPALAQAPPKVKADNVQDLLNQLTAAIPASGASASGETSASVAAAQTTDTTRKITRSSVLSAGESFIAQYARESNMLEGAPMQEPPVGLEGHIVPGRRGSLVSSKYTLPDGHIVAAVPPPANCPPFTQLHDDMLRDVLAVHAHLPWPAITQVLDTTLTQAGVPLPGLTPQNVKRRSLALQAANRRSGQWTPVEDEQLRWLLHNLVEVAKQGGPQSDRHLRHVQWSDVAFRMMWRTGKQCRDRWFNNLDPLIRRGPFSSEELTTMLAAYKRLGKRWTDISKLLPGRSESMVKNWFMARERSRKRNAARAAAQ